MLLALPAAHGGFLQMRDGYFWDPAAGGYFLARGIAYQTFNPEVGATQSPEQIRFDLEEFVRLRANSVRCEFVWSQLQVASNRWDWTKSDLLVAEAERLGLRLFVIIGFQYPPAWFPAEWQGVNDRILTEPGNTNEWRSDVLNYEHPEARLAYSNHLAQVAARYRDSPAIGGWILGNEYAYFDLWEDIEKYPNRRILGHDAWSLAAFRRYLREKHGTLATLNARWGTGFASFEEVPMPGRLPGDRRSPAHQDAYQWRKWSVADFVALGAQAVRAHDPNHLLTYSMVGGLFNGLDANYTAEDGHAIVTRCREAGAPLDFWSLNNYAWAALGSEMRSGDFGIAKYQAQAGLPVMISETGFSSTENLFDFPLSGRRQADALPGALWEAYMAGAIGWHIFTWPDRPRYGEGFFPRERGFGVVQPNRLPKTNVFDNIRRVFLQLHNLGAERLFGGSSHPPPDVQFFWSEDADLGWPIANQENAMLWGAFKRAGYQPGLLDDAQFQAGAWSNAPVLLLSRGFQLRPEYLDALRTQVVPHGIHLHANADLPGQFDAWSRPNADWLPFLREVFGVEAAGAATWVDLWATNAGGANFTLSQTAAGLPAGTFNTWKAWHGLAATAGTTVAARFLPEGQGGAPQPALFLRTAGGSRRALNAFALGDSFATTGRPEDNWDFRSGFLRHIYAGHFGVAPSLPLTVTPGHVFVDWRPVRRGGRLISLLNGGTNTATATLALTGPLAGLVVEDLLRGGRLTPQDGRITRSLAGDEFALWYAYPPQPGGGSPVDPSPARLWVTRAPGSVTPGGLACVLGLRASGLASEGMANVALEQLAPVRREVTRAGSGALIAPDGEVQLALSVPGRSAANRDYLPSDEGGVYRLRTWVEQDGVRVAGTTLPVRLEEGVRPLEAVALDANRVRVRVAWSGIHVSASEGEAELSRAEWWDSLAVGTHRLGIVAGPMVNGVLAPTQVLRTAFGAGTTDLVVDFRQFPFAERRWGLEVQREEALLVRSPDLFDSFEGRTNGALTGLLARDPAAESPFAPWYSYQYGTPAPVWWDEGVHPLGFHGSQSAFLVLTNRVGATGAGFGIKRALPRSVALPASVPQRVQWVFGFAFREASGHPCRIELQLANPDVPGQAPHVLHHVRDYTPGPDGWDEFRVPVSAFVQPGWSPGFDHTNVTHLVCNVQMLRDGVMYLGSFDAIHFDGPETPAWNSGFPLATYRPDLTVPTDQDGDGLPDAVETGTGVWVSETNTGTRPDRADSDGDGVPDGAEIEAGTDPNDPADTPGFTAARLLPGGVVELHWLARPGRIYTLESRPVFGTGGFAPLDGIPDVFSLTGGEQVMPVAADDEERYFRLVVRRP